MNTQAPRLLHPRAKGLHRLTTPQCCTLEHAGGTPELYAAVAGRSSAQPTQVRTTSQPVQALTQLVRAGEVLRRGGGKETAVGARARACAVSRADRRALPLAGTTDNQLSTLASVSGKPSDTSP